VTLTPEMIKRIKLETLERLDPCRCPIVYDPDSPSNSLRNFLADAPPPVDEGPVYCPDCGRRKMPRPRLVPGEWPPKQV
jgi:hypothetical protein